ncbi:uncharacterized protein JN550_008359 [Neoarthrinium moseri]|uniref:uncharacterized protein n=1 Tax=Neoarthrinium moseri TaxID=1658444 RepID=UPI001FDC43D8|nr:uncharacterized protein JN550_008359 [Neoarthrinium moseri]KAI1865311.1 hypothetical protein JN550_008359 [Neoarthrinium moseri]
MAVDYDRRTDGIADHGAEPHQLNHDPQKVFRCDVPDCSQSFVRFDLLERHKKRHGTNYVPRNRTSSFSTSAKVSSPDVTMMTPGSSTSTNGQGQPAYQPGPPRTSSILLSPESNPVGIPPTSLLNGHGNPVTTSTPWSQPVDPVNVIRPRNGGYAPQPTMHDHTQASFAPFSTMDMPTDPNDFARNNFAMWLFDSQRNFADFSMSNLPFFEGGLESPFNNQITYENESLTSRSQMDLTPPRLTDMPDDTMPEFRRQEILTWVRMFRQKQMKTDPLYATLLHDSGDDIPGLSPEMLRECLRHFWDHVAPRLPIVHQPTFSPASCSVFLLLVMIALGAASVQAQSPSMALKEHGAFADLIITCVRWEILTAEDASPPVDLWVAQALLLLEFYEKLISTRKLHERANIYHSATLTLLRRGSPLIGRSGSESPPDVPASADQGGFDGRAWWIRWAETEAMHRVVFAAFMMDIVHAAMFQHTADMAPHEIRLPLPCDDNLWSASSPEELRQLEASFRMYGVKPVTFLDGLKRAIHGKEVQTHPFGRMIIMCGLLSVGWHLNHRETHLKWLDMSSSSTDTREKWSQMLLQAFDGWKRSFDDAMGSSSSGFGASTQQHGSNGLIQSAAVLYHLAHMSLYVDMIDCQVFAGAKRLVGRKITMRDHSNVVSRMRIWAAHATTRHAVLHAFKLLHSVLIDPRQRRLSAYHNGTASSAYGAQYSCRTDPDPHRPWIMYYATLTIWSYVKAISSRSASSSTVRPSHSPQSRRRENLADYLSKVANLQELDSSTATTLEDTLPILLDTVGGLAAKSHYELLREAHDRLERCKELLETGAS